MFQRTDQLDHQTRQGPHRAVVLAVLLGVVALLGTSCGNDTTDEGGSVDSDASAESTETTSAPEGVEFTSPDGDYEVTFPSEPSEQAQQVPLPGGQVVEAPLQVASDSMSNFTATVVEYPDDVALDDVDEVLDGAVDGAVANVEGATLANSEEIEMDGTAGRRFEFDVQQGNAFAQGQAVFFVEGQKMYQAIAVGPKDDADAHEAFVDSFKIL